MYYFAIILTVEKYDDVDSVVVDGKGSITSAFAIELCLFKSTKLCVCLTMNADVFCSARW